MTMEKRQFRMNSKQTQSISNEKLCAYIQNSKGHCHAAMTLLLQQNEGMIRLITAQECRRYSHLTVEVEDLWQAGRLGMLHAAELFSIQRDTAFTTYAWLHVRQAIQREIANSGTIIHIPVYLHEYFHRNPTGFTKHPGKTKNKFETTRDSDANQPWQKSENHTILRMESLNMPISIDNTIELQEIIADEKTLAPDEFVEIKLVITACLDCLSPRERDVVVMRYGLEGKNQYTLHAIGEELKITKERVRQIESKALQKMRAFLED